VSFSEPGTYAVEYRAADREGNTSEIGRTEVVVVPASSCTFARSDDFEDGTIDPRWTLRTGPDHQITEEGGRLVLPVLWELDGAQTGPVSFAGQQVPDGDWSLTTRMTINSTSMWQSGGLYLWQSDNNFIKFGMTWHGPGRNFEMTADTPPNGTRVFTSNESADEYGTTVWLRMFRNGNAIHGQYAMDENGSPGDWVTHSGTHPVGTNPPREGEGVLVGVYAGGQQNAPWNLEAAFDHVDFTPDTAECAGELEAPSTSATIDGEAPEPSYPGPVDVQLSATDGTDADASGVAYIEHRSGTTGDWTREENTGSADPFVVEVPVTERGEQRLQYRAADNNGNVGPIKELVFAVGPGGDSDVYASDSGGMNVWVPDELAVPLDEVVTWHFDDASQGGSASAPHNVYLIRPGDPVTGGFLVGPEVVPPGGDPVDYRFDEQGTWTFYCSIHAAVRPGDDEWTGMVGTVDVGPPGPDAAAPTTTSSVTSVTAPATVRLSASDGTRANASGVAYLDYAIGGPLPADGSEGPGVTRVINSGGAEPFVHDIQISTPGTYTIAYRAVDEAGNREDAQTRTVAVTPVSTGPGPGPGPGPGGPPAGSGPGPQDEVTTAALRRLPSLKLERFLRRGVTVRTACEAGERGTLRIEVSRNQARAKLRLRRSLTIAVKRFTCGANDSTTLRVKPSRKAKRALQKARGRTLVAAVVVQVGTGRDAARDREKLVLRRR
jgi:plastocyanin